MRVIVTPLARESLRDISRYLDRVSTEASRRTVRRLLERVRQLADFPESGRVVPEFQTAQVRELIEGRYRIWYRVSEDRIEVLAVIHGARQVLDD